MFIRASFPYKVQVLNSVKAILFTSRRGRVVSTPTWTSEIAGSYFGPHTAYRDFRLSLQANPR